MTDLLWQWSCDKRDTLAAGLEAYRLRFGCDPPVILVARPDARELEGIPIQATERKPVNGAWFALPAPVARIEQKELDL